MHYRVLALPSTFAVLIIACSDGSDTPAKPSAASLVVDICKKLAVLPCATAGGEQRCSDRLGVELADAQ